MGQGVQFSLPGLGQDTLVTAPGGLQVDTVPAVGVETFDQQHLMLPTGRLGQAGPLPLIICPVAPDQPGGTVQAAFVSLGRLFDPGSVDGQAEHF